MDRNNQLGPFYQTRPPKGLKGILISDWELDDFSAIARKKGKKLSIEQGYVAFPRGKRPIVTHWLVNRSSCPFLKNDGLCSVHKNRPLVCRRYPVSGPNVFTSIKRREPLGIALAAQCRRSQETDLPSFFFSLKGIYEKFDYSFGNCFKAKLESDADGLFVLGIFRRLEKEGKLELERQPISGKAAYLKSKKGERFSETMSRELGLGKTAAKRAIKANRKKLIGLFSEGNVSGIRNFSLKA